MCFASVADAAGYNCPAYRKYTSCNSGYYISECDSIQSNWQTGVSVNPNGLKAGNSCKSCPSGYTCSGLLSCPRSSEVTITYNLNGGSGTKPANKICYKGQTCPLNSGNTNSFYRAGYQFVGWATSSTATSGFVIFTPNTISNTMTVYAVWKACTGATYKNSSANASAACSTCPSGYSMGGTALTSINACRMYVNDGQYLAERYSSTTERCPAGYACLANAINYGTISEERPTYFYQCTGATFSRAGSGRCFDCPSGTSGWTRGEGVGWTDNSSCYQYRNATDISPYCASGELRQYGNRGSVGSGWSDEIVEYTTFQARPGSVVEGSGANMTCDMCNEYGYSPGGDIHQCLPCPDPSSGFMLLGNNHTTITECAQVALDASVANPNCVNETSDGAIIGQIATSSGEWGNVILAVGVAAAPGAIVHKQVIASGGDMTARPVPLELLCTECDAGTYSAGGTATSCTACPALTPGFEYGTNTGLTSYTQCVRYTTNPGAVNSNCVSYDTAGYAAISQQAGSPTAWDGTTIALGVAAKPGAVLDSRFQDNALRVQGAYDFDDMCTQCGVGTYSPGGDVKECTACPALTPGFVYQLKKPNDAVGATSFYDCRQMAKASDVNNYCEDTEDYTGAYYNIYQATTDGVYWNVLDSDYLEPVPGAHIDSRMANSRVVIIDDGAYDIKNLCQICPDNTYSLGGNVTPSEDKGTEYLTSCTACLDNYTTTGDALTDHDSASDCKITCSGGEYVPTAGDGCVNVGVGYWGAGGTVSQTSTLGRNECASGLTTIGFGLGANEAGDCGRVLNIGDEKIYLRSTKKTTPSLNISINGDVFYGNMSTATKGSLRINSGGTTYSVYDDSM